MTQGEEQPKGKGVSRRTVLEGLGVAATYVAATYLPNPLPRNATTTQPVSTTNTKGAGTPNALATPITSPNKAQAISELSEVLKSPQAQMIDEFVKAGSSSPNEFLNNQQLQQQVTDSIAEVWPTFTEQPAQGQYRPGRADALRMVRRQMYASFDQQDPDTRENIWGWYPEQLLALKYVAQLPNESAYPLPTDTGLNHLPTDDREARIDATLALIQDVNKLAAEKDAPGILSRTKQAIPYVVIRDQEGFPGKPDDSYEDSLRSNPNDHLGAAVSAAMATAWGMLDF
jgi:hypothetical protein